MRTKTIEKRISELPSGFAKGEFNRFLHTFNMAVIAVANNDNKQLQEELKWLEGFAQAMQSKELIPTTETQE